MTRWIRRVLIAITSIAVAFALFILGAAFYGSQQLTHPRWMADSRTIKSNPREAFGLAFDDVEFKAEDGATLRGWWIPGSTEVGVVTVHGAGANRGEFLDEAKWLHDAGYAVLLFDCRAHGLSDEAGRGISMGVREHRDVESAAAFMR